MKSLHRLSPAAIRIAGQLVRGVAMAGLVWVGSAHAQSGSSANSRYDYVVVFPVGMDPARIEGWRQQVLGRVHQLACVRDRPCIARMLRMALAGAAGREVIGFDLMRDTPAVERAAIIAAAQTTVIGTAIHADSRPIDLEARQPPASAP